MLLNPLQTVNHKPSEGGDGLSTSNDKNALRRKCRLGEAPQQRRRTTTLRRRQRQRSGHQVGDLPLSRLLSRAACVSPLSVPEQTARRSPSRRLSFVTRQIGGLTTGGRGKDVQVHIETSSVCRLTNRLWNAKRTSQPTVLLSAIETEGESEAKDSVVLDSEDASSTPSCHV